MKRPARLLLFFCSSSIIVGVGSVAIAFVIFSIGMPKLETIDDYRPPIVTELFANDGTKIGEFSVERRFVVDLDQIPKHVQQAFIAAEDKTFFSHRGIDVMGVVRAVLKNTFRGRWSQGASTITQQVARSLLLTREKTITRKLREWILALHIEQQFTKEQILTLYLNQIYLGHGAYGVEAAAQNYFKKSIADVNLAEAAILAGLTQRPSDYSPLLCFPCAKKRQRYVLSRMVKNQLIDSKDAEQAVEVALQVFPRIDLNLELAPHFVEETRQFLMEHFGETAVFNDGLKVYTTLDVARQRAANRAVVRGLKELDQRQGFRGALANLPEADWPTYDRQSRIEFIMSDESLNRGFHQDLPIGDWPLIPLVPGNRYHAIVSEIDNNANEAHLLVVGRPAILQKHDMDWARPRTEAPLKAVKDVLKVGDLIWVTPRIPESLPASKLAQSTITYVTLDQEPLVEGALLSYQAGTNRVLAMVGGKDFTESKFNRAIQAHRQPGSSFKPIIYAAALDKGYTTATMIQDAPIVYEQKNRDEETWKPKNYEGKFHGDTLLRTGIVRSMNVVTIKILQEIGLNYVAAYARKLGIRSPLARNLSMALGASDVTLQELLGAYSIFASGGRVIPPFFITKVVDRDGQVLFRQDVSDNDVSLREELDLLARQNLHSIAPHPHVTVSTLIDGLAQDFAEHPASRLPTGVDEDAPFVLSDDERQILLGKESPFETDRVTTPQTAYLMTYLLTEVVRHGTGQRVAVLPRATAGKTGTTNDELDTWFFGFTPDLLCGVWVGFDTKAPLGPGENGGRTAAPLWLYYMEEAIKGTPERPFDTPSGIVFAKVDKKTGQLATADDDNTIFLPFIKGTEPGSGESSLTDTQQVDDETTDLMKSL